MTDDEGVTSTSAIIRFSSVLLSALSTGVLVGTRTSLGPSTRDFTPATYVEVQQATVRNLRPVMGVLLPSAVVANAAVLALTWRDRRSPAFALRSVGLAGQLTALVLTAAVELPINARVLTWSPDEPPQGWQDVRDRWADRAHGPDRERARRPGVPGGRSHRGSRFLIIGRLDHRTP